MSDTPDDGPPILRPIPRRPFNLNIRDATPPDEANDESSSSSPSSPSSPRRANNRNNAPPALNLESLNSRLLHDSSINRSNSNVALATPGSETTPGNGSSSISRAQSILNLTGSTLMGIYTPTTYGQDRMSSMLSDSKDGGPGTPWGTGAETPARLGDIEDRDEDDVLSDDEDEDADDDETEGEREMRRRRRSSLLAAEAMGRRRASLLMQARPPHTTLQQQQLQQQILSQASPLSMSSLPALALRLAPRALLLSALGVLYGILVARVLDRFRPIMGAPTTNSYDWKYMTFWGVSGVVLGGLLPWFDGVWEDAFGRQQGGDESLVVGAEQRRQRRRQGRRSVGGGAGIGGSSVPSGKGPQPQEGVGEEAAVPGPDWSLAVRGIGAFAGIAFAIRKLAWDSTLQVSITLALVNPVLWYLIDRSVPGLLMAGAVGIAGSAIFMAPLASSSMPFAASFSPWAYLLDNSNSNSNGDGDWNQQQQSFNESSSSYHGTSNSDPLPIFNGGGGGGGLGGGTGSGGSGIHHLESAVWMLSVLFCCCVCFGNIGRWLALMSRNNHNVGGGSGGGNRARAGSVSGGAVGGFAKGGR